MEPRDNRQIRRRRPMTGWSDPKDNRRCQCFRRGLKNSQFRSTQVHEVRTLLAVSETASGSLVCKVQINSRITYSGFVDACLANSSLNIIEFMVS